MTSDRRRRFSERQPELPLPTEAQASHARLDEREAHDSEGPGVVEEWRLDERTRRIGLQGVAAARARLERDEGGQTTAIEAPHRRSRRAA